MSLFKNSIMGGASLVVQWLRICLPMQGARVRSLVGELDPTCMPKLRVRMLQLRIPHAATKTCRNEDPDGRVFLFVFGFLVL